MVNRTVNRTGSTSRIVVLPKDYCAGAGLDVGSHVQLRYGNLLLIVPPGKEAEADRLVKANGGNL